jgi:hypothetical protein
LPATEGTWPIALTSAGAPRWPVRSIATGSTLLLLVLGAFLVARRVTGGITSLLPLWLLIPTALALVAWAWFVRLTRPTGAELRSPDASFAVWLPCSTVLLFAIACSYPGTRFVDWLVWPAALAAVRFGPKRFFPVWLISPRNGDKLRGEQLLQDLKRYRTAEGREFLRGMITAEFSSGQRSTTLYAAFCPPFEQLPQVAAEMTGNLSASVQVAQVLHNGVQLEVRLARTTDRQQFATIELFAAEPVADTPV